MKFNILVVLGAAALLSACDSYSAQQYQTNPQNTIALQTVAQAGRHATVGTVTVAESVNPRPACRLAGPIDIGGDVASVVQQAFLAEFLAANIYRANATALNITVTEMEPDSLAGNWAIGLHVASSRGALDVRQVTDFSTSFSAMSACNNTADAFNRALGAAILAVVQHPDFRSLL